MIPLNRTYAPVQALVEELARCGMTHAVTSPGSRNAPIVLTLAAQDGIEAISVLDERSAGFVALGIARATGRPVAVTCTSGTAAANLMPAVEEARESRLPLIVLTADRPPELRDVGAGQAIDQLKLYGTAVKWFVEVGNHEPGRDTAVHHRALACRAYWTALEGRPGPVHLNLPLREALAPAREHLDEADWQGREDGEPWTRVALPAAEPDGADVAWLAGEIVSSPRGAIVCGPGLEHLGRALPELAAASGWPLLAEPTSNVRCGPHERSHVISHYDVLLRDEEWARGSQPDLVLRIGDMPTSKPLRAWLARARQVVVDPHGAWHEPTRYAESILRASAGALCTALALELHAGELPVRPDAEWLTRWRDADSLVPAALAEAPDPFEPKAYAALADALPDDALVWLSSSMPVRDVEAFFPSVATPVRFLANRGANGIDGVVSSALGAALASPGRRTYLLTGELALLHDLGGLLAARRAGAELTIVCVNNGGGGIFDFLPVAASADPEHYERHVATPVDVPLEEVAALAGLRHVRASTPDEVRAAVAEPGIVEVRTDRAQSVAEHRALYERVARQLSG